MKKNILIFIFLLNAWPAFSESPLQVDRLLTEYMENPLGIAELHPRFQWSFKTHERNQFQYAYEIIASRHLGSINEGVGDAWSTGKIISAQNAQLEYNGEPLQSFTRYYWRVRIYNQDNQASDWSQPAWFETAMLNVADWSAKWINDGSINPAKDEDYYQPDPMPLLRKEFSASKKITAARWYISGIGYYEAYLNGEKVGDHVLDPGFTTYSKQVFYVSYDVTSKLRSGKNIAGFMLGNGWWNPLPFKFFGKWDLRDYQQTGRPCVKAELHIRYADGSMEKIITDENWLTSPGPVTQNNVYLGETYDARLEQKNWNTRGANRSLWKKAKLTEGPAGILVPQMLPPIRITKILKPVKITEAGKDTFIVDMGQNFAGVARIKVKATPGTKINLRYGEDLFKDGRLNYLTTVATQIKKGIIKGGPGAPETAWQEDSYILKGEGTESWSPRFTFHGFRYVEITGWPGRPGPDDVEGLRMNSDVTPVGSFACSNNDFNKLHEAIQWTFLSNIFSVQSDCPAREKMGYGGDMVATANAFMYNYDMAQFYRKTVQDFSNEQRPEGGITEIAPFTGIADKGYGDGSGPLGWQLAFPFLQKKLYEFYGDKKIIADNYPAFTRQMNFLESKADQGLFHWDISDHEALDPKPEAFTASAFYYHHAKLAEEFASILSTKEDSIRYHKLASQIKGAIIHKYLVPKTGRFDNATQSAQIFALWYGFSPEPGLSWKVLINEFERHNWHLSTGIFSTQMLFDIMRKQNENEIAYHIASQKDYPGWLNMLRNNATTLWETWAYPEAFPSQNHPMFGSIDEWFYRSLLGINAAAPGFGKIIIKPQPVKELSWAKGSYRSVNGEIKTEWEKDGSTFLLRAWIPANTKAMIYIPSRENGVVKETGKALAVHRYEKGYAVIEVGSGEYFFSAVMD